MSAWTLARPASPAPRHHAHYPVADVGGWSHSNWAVREVAAQPGFWDYAQVPRGTLTALVRDAGRVGCVYALEAWTMLSGRVLLMDGCHRWAVADDLGLPDVPVVMGHEARPAGPWSRWAP